MHMKCCFCALQSGNEGSTLRFRIQMTVNLVVLIGQDGKGSMVCGSPQLNPSMYGNFCV